ncbi:MAG: thioredoxin domain-containing protein, partial [Gammaproteobacteria bacterium]|nr:thioredoxin domain-containing protein [Gammaproteobacteria bacterium]
HFVYYDFPLTEIHAHAVLAARAGRCASDQGKFWEYHDLVFARQSSWAYARSAPVDAFRDYAEQLGLDGGAFQACLESDAHADVVTANRLLGERLGVPGTPTVIIDNRRVSDPLALDALIEVIEASVQETGA